MKPNLKRHQVVTASVR